MNFNSHYDLEGKHAFLSASQFRWINYDEDRLITSYENSLAKLHGTELHKFAYDCIRLRQKLPASNKTLNSYVNDAIKYRMTPEQILYYSNFCFGTAFTISRLALLQHTLSSLWFTLLCFVLSIGLIPKTLTWSLEFINPMIFWFTALPLTRSSLLWIKS